MIQHWTSVAVRRGTAMAVVGLALVSSAQAEIEWTQKRLVLEPAVGAQQAEGFFEFTNRGKAPVKIVDVESSCGCTVAAQDQQVVEPGAKGRIRAQYHVADREGKQTVNVTVNTLEPEARRHELMVEVNIPQFAHIVPRLLYWRVGEEVVAKQLQLSLFGGFKLVSAESASADFAVKIDKQEGDEAALSVTPRDLWAKRTGSIKVKLAQPGKEPVEVSVVVRVI